MSFADFQERLSRSIKVVDLPNNYAKEDIIENLKNAGTIEDTKLGPNAMIVTFSNSNEKDLCKMYDGCPVGDYTLKLEDPTSLEIGSGEAAIHEEKVEEKKPEPEAPATYTHYEPKTEYNPPVHHHEEPVHHHEPVVHHVEPVHVEPVHEPVVHHVEPVHVEPVHVEPVHVHHEPVVEPVHHVEPEVHHHEPVVHHVEPVHVEPVHVHHEPEVKPVEPVHQHYEAPKHHEPEPVHHVEKVEPTPVPVVVEKKIETQPERKPEVVHTEKKVEVAPTPVVEKKSEVVSHHARSGESSKDLLRELQNTNLPARAGLPNDDLFQVVTKRSYLLIFTMVWGLQLFLRSVF